MHHVHFNKSALPEMFQTYFETNEHSHKYETRQKLNYKILKSNKKWGDCTLQNIGARLWNNLSLSLKSISNCKTFSKKVKETIIASYQS